MMHVPHASTVIPPEVRGQLLLADVELARELERMTDERTDELAAAAAALVVPRPWLFVNCLSRLVVDPERFPDEREEMRRVGMGAVYHRTSAGLPLRAVDVTTEADLIDAAYTPYTDALADLVDSRIAATGRAVLIDLHSYPRDALPYELHQDARRPEICLGTDSFHTPAQLTDSARHAFTGLGDVVLNEPFAGTYVPSRHYQKDHQVSSIMIELRRDTYLDADGELRGPAAERIHGAIAALLRGAQALGCSPNPRSGP
jgi:N-formylglutamate amidohydrolase